MTKVLLTPAVFCPENLYRLPEIVAKAMEILSFYNGEKINLPGDLEGEASNRFADSNDEEQSKVVDVSFSQKDIQFSSDNIAEMVGLYAASDYLAVVEKMQKDYENLSDKKLDEEDIQYILFALRQGSRALPFILTPMVSNWLMGAIPRSCFKLKENAISIEESVEEKSQDHENPRKLSSELTFSKENPNVANVVFQDYICKSEFIKDGVSQKEVASFEINIVIDFNNKTFTIEKFSIETEDEEVLKVLGAQEGEEEVTLFSNCQGDPTFPLLFGAKTFDGLKAIREEFNCEKFVQEKEGRKNHRDQSRCKIADIVTLSTFLNETIVRLQAKKKDKGAEDKIKLYKKVKSQLSGIGIQSEDFAEQLGNVIKAIALISHHRRHSKKDRINPARLFKPVAKSWSDWVKVVKKLSYPAIAEVAGATLHSKAARTVIINNQEIDNYNDYRKAVFGSSSNESAASAPAATP